MAAIGLLVVSVGVAVFAWVFSLLSADVVARSRASAAGPESWLSRGGAWQWDVITGLGLSGALIAAFVVWACFGGRRRCALAGALSWVAIGGVIAVLVWHASPTTGGGLLIWQLAGVALLVAAVAGIPADR